MEATHKHPPRRWTKEEIRFRQAFRGGVRGPEATTSQLAHQLATKAGSLRSLSATCHRSSGSLVDVAPELDTPPWLSGAVWERGLKTLRLRGEKFHQRIRTTKSLH